MKSTILGLLLSVSIFAQTRVHPSQIRDWRQVSPRVIYASWPQHGVDLYQLNISPPFLIDWKTLQYYSWYEIVYDSSEQGPTLLYPPDGLKGFWKFWYQTPLPTKFYVPTV